MQKRKSVYKHFYFAQVIPLICYLVFSLFGYAIFDHGAILTASINVAHGLAPYRDFHWVTTPFTLYTQAILQHLFWVIPPIILSVCWKGIIFVILSFTFLVFISKINLEIGTKKPLPTPLIYLLSLTFFLVGPINETHAGYTPDAIFFATMGILLMLWPKPGTSDFIRNEPIHFIGYFLLGLGFCYKQEIGLISLTGGIFFILTKYFIIFKQPERGNLWNLMIIPIFLTLLPAFLLYSYLSLTGQFRDFFYSVFIIPSQIKQTGFRTLISLLTFGMGSELKKLVLSICVGLFTFIVAWQINSGKAFPATVLKKYIFEGKSGKILFWMFLITVILSGFSQLVAENSWIGIVFPPRTESNLTRMVNSFTGRLFTDTGLILISSSLSLFIFSWFNLDGREKVSIPFLRYFLGVILLFMLFDGAALAGLTASRFSRIIIPLLYASTMIGLVYTGNFLNHKKIAFKNIYWGLLTIIIFFICTRFGSSMFSPVMSDPLHRQISYCGRLKCYIDKEVLHSMESMKRIINKDTNARVFIYQSESMLYYYFEKRPSTFSIIHYIDFYPRSFDPVEIKKLALVRYVVTQSNIDKENSFLYREDDPIRKYVENNYLIIYSDNYYTLWEKLAPKNQGD
ncbi:MAG: hypothetical protein M0Q38_16945 [Bacteroidales bacterium]|jgi:hypothetical protein|nr:hypothetical protein [Bacteroidales bacterium]